MTPAQRRAITEENKRRAALNAEASPEARRGHPDYDELPGSEVRETLDRARALAVYAEANPPADAAVAAHLKERVAAEIAKVTAILDGELKFTTRLALTKLLERLQKMHAAAVELGAGHAGLGAEKRSVLIALVTQVVESGAEARPVLPVPRATAALLAEVGD